MPVLYHGLSFGRPGSPGRRRRVAAGDRKPGASGSVAGLGLFLPSEIYRVIKHWG